MPKTIKANEVNEPVISDTLNNIQHVKPVTDFPFVYANNAVATFTEVDCSILLGEMVGKDEQGRTLIIPKTKVIMALPFVKEFRDMLVKHVESFESEFGAIQSFVKKEE